MMFLSKKVVSDIVTWSGPTRLVTHPNPNDADPRTINLLDVSETPIGKAGDDRGHELCEAEGTHQRIRRTLHEEEPVGASNEDKSLRDDGDLEVDDRVKLRVVVVDMMGRRIETDMELPLEEVRLKDNDDENNPARMN